MRRSVAEQLAGFEPDAVVVTPEQVRRVFASWEESRRRGECEDISTVAEMSVEDVAIQTTEEFFRLIKEF